LIPKEQGTRNERTSELGKEKRRRNTSLVGIGRGRTRQTKKNKGTGKRDRFWGLTGGGWEGPGGRAMTWVETGGRWGSKNEMPNFLRKTKKWGWRQPGGGQDSAK